MTEKNNQSISLEVQLTSDVFLATNDSGVIKK
jgi:hypothetical protein